MFRKYSFYFLLILVFLLIGGCSIQSESPKIANTLTITPTPTPTPAPTLTPSPFPIPVLIDGTLQPGEWSSGERYILSDDSELYLIQQGDILYLAVSGSSPGILGANVYIFQENIIRIMHISAALGTAEYIQENGSWSLSRNFNWKHRLIGNGDAALTEREDYFNEEGWAAPNARTGQANHLEMQILIQSGSKIAISLIDPGSNDRIVWPAGLSDDTGTVFSTGLPAEINLEPDGWHLIE